MAGGSDKSGHSNGDGRVTSPVTRDLPRLVSTAGRSHAPLARRESVHSWKAAGAAHRAAGAVAPLRRGSRLSSRINRSHATCLN